MSDEGQQLFGLSHCKLRIRYQSYPICGSKIVHNCQPTCTNDCIIKKMSDEAKYPITIFYDGACGICKREMERYGANDKLARLKFVNANSPDFHPESEGLDAKKVLDYIHAKDQNGKIVYGAEAFVWIWRACGYKFLPIFAQLPVVKQLARVFYRLFARYRYQLSGKKGEKLVCGPECDHPMV